MKDILKKTMKNRCRRGIGLFAVVFWLFGLCACASLDGGTEMSGNPAMPAASEGQPAGAAPEVTGEEAALLPGEDQILTIHQNIPINEEAALLPREDQSGRYCYETLTEDEKLWYEDMYAIMSGMHQERLLSLQGNDTVGEQGMDKVFQCVMNDHPELFYVKGYTYTHYTYGGETTKFSFSGSYTMDMAEREKRQEQIDAAVETCLQGISKEASDYEKMKYIYEYLITSTEYDQQAEDNQNICSVFIGRRSVCQGYAKATQYLLEKLGIQSTLVIGTVYGNESHAWNLVQLDGAYYYVDTTWGDASYQILEEGNSVSEEYLPAINYDYLCVTTEQLLKTHVIDNVVPLPRCVAMDDNYYVREGAYFTAYDEEQVKAFFERGYEENRTDVTIKCADNEVYHTFFGELITSQKIFKYLTSPDGVIAYAEDPDRLSLTFWLVNE